MPKEKFLTNRQKELARFIVEGTYSNAECARKAGYSEGQAAKTASLLLNGKDFPLVVTHVKELREARERKYGVTLLGQLKRFADLSKGAEETGIDIDLLSNGFKIRTTSGDANSSSASIIYVAMAHNPFKYATAR